jgi:hypothetical protein
VSFSAALLSIIVSYIALRQRDKPGGLPLGLLMLADRVETDLFVHCHFGYGYSLSETG